MSGFTNLPKFDVESSGKHEGVSIDFARLTAPAGERVPPGLRVVNFGNGVRLSPGSRSYVAVQAPPSNVTAVDITWIVQKTRTVEFLVKPSTP